MRRDDALLTVAGLSVSVFLMMAGPSMAIAAADPGGSNGNGGNSSSGKAGSGKSSSSRGNAGNGNAGNGGSRGNSGANSSVSGQTNTGKSSKANGKSNNTAPGAGGSDNPATVPMFTPPNPPVPVIVAEQHTGTSPGGTWWGAPGAPQPIIEVHELSVPSEEGDADLLSADHTGIPVWAAAEPVGLRGDLFGLAGLVLMPLIGLAVGYRQAKAARDIGQTLPS